MKKRYIKPEVEVMEIENEALMISISVPDGDGPDYGGEATDKEADANGRRGS